MSEFATKAELEAVANRVEETERRIVHALQEITAILDLLRADLQRGLPTQFRKATTESETTQ